MYKLNQHSLTRGEWFEPETQSMTLAERNTVSSITLGPDAPEIAFNDWILDEEWPEGPTVWRVKSIDDQTDSKTVTVSLEHVIRLLEDIKLFEAVETGDISGGDYCTARQAIEYLLAQQDDWVLGDLRGDDVSLPYEFSGGDSLFDAIESVSDTLEDAEWWYDLSRYPFVLHIRKRNSSVMSEMRGERNLSTLRRNISRSGMYTRIWPVGYNDLHISGAYLSKNESLYGRVDKVETNQGKTSEDSLRAWARAMLRKHCEPNVTITISGLELSQETGEPLDWIQLNRVCRCPLPEFHTTILERVIKIAWRDRRKDPESITVTLGNNAADVQDLTKTVSETSKSSGSAARGQAKQNYLFEANGEHLLYEVFDECGHLHGVLRMTEQSLRVAFENLNECTRSEFYMTSESLRVQFENEINSTRSEFQMTSESLRVTFENEINSTRSEFQMTSESLRVAFENEVESVRSQVEQTDRSWKASVAGVAGADGKVTAASIGVAINESGSNAFINADHIHLTGNTLLSGQLTVEDGALKVLTALAVGNTTGKIVTINNGKINVPDTLQISSGAELLFVGSQTGERYSFTAANVGNILVDAAIANSVLTVSRKNGNTALSVGVSGNSLVFTDGNGQTLSFSKATTLEGAWSSGKLTVSAYQTNNGTKTLVRSYTSNHELSLNGNGSSSFSVEMKTQDTGESAQTVRASKYIYLHENVNGTSSTVVAGENADGTESVGSISTRATYNAGKTAGNAEGQAEYKALVRSRFKSSSGGYYIEGYESNSGNSISGSDTTYKLGTSGSTDSTVVQIQNSSGTKISETAELSVGSLYTDGYTAGNANRASQVKSVNVSGATDEEEPVQKTLIANTKYKILSQYKDAEGNWNDGGTYIVKTPANSPGTATIGHQDAVGTTKTRGRPLVYAKLNGTTKQTLNLYLHRSTYTNDNGDTGLHCVDIHAKVDAQAATTDPIIGRISTQTIYNSGKSAGAAGVTVSISRDGGKFTAKGSNGASDSYELGSYGMVITKKTAQGSGWFNFTFEATLKESWSLGSITFYR